jgi:endonuclease G
MNLRKTVAGLAALLLLTAGAGQAGNWLHLIFPPQHRHEQGRPSPASRSLSQRESLALYSAEQRQPSFQACADQFPDNKPLHPARLAPTHMKPLSLCSDNFAVLYSQTSKTPLVVVERLSAGQLAAAKGEERTDRFYADPRVPRSGRAELSDYRGQYPAVDRGHQAPAADAPDQNAMAQTFALSNMVPQDPDNNRKAWNKIENDVRKFTRRAKGNVYVFTGPLFDQGHETIGENRVWKPTRLYKLVYDEASGRAWAYVVRNSEVRVEAPIDYPAFVRATGLRLLDGVTITGSAGRS